MPKRNIDLSSIQNDDLFMDDSMFEFGDIKPSIVTLSPKGQGLPLNALSAETQIIPLPPQSQIIEPVMPNEEEIIQKRRLIISIRRYLFEFSKYLADFQDRNLNDLSARELEVLLKEIQFTVSVRNSSNIIVNNSDKFLFMIESMCVNYTPLKISGFSNLSKDPDFQDLLKEYALEHSTLFYVKTEYRILLKLLTTMFSLHTYNSLIEKQKDLLVEIKKNIETKQLDSNLADIDKEFDKIGF